MLAGKPTEIFPTQCRLALRSQDNFRMDFKGIYMNVKI